VSATGLSSVPAPAALPQLTGRRRPPDSNRGRVFALEIVERVPIQVPPNEHNSRYLKTKKDKLGHLLDDMD
jgi:GTP cyclohydrolase II